VDDFLLYFGFYIYKHYINNIAYTNIYWERDGIKLIHDSVVLAISTLSKKLLSNDILNQKYKFPQELLKFDAAFNKSERNLLRTIIEKNQPYVGLETDLSQVLLSDLENFLSDRDEYLSARILYYLVHMCYTISMNNKNSSNYYSPSIEFPVLSGPMISSLLFRRLSLNDAVIPRKELLEYVRVHTGSNFTAIRDIKNHFNTSTLKLTPDYKLEEKSMVIDKYGNRIDNLLNCGFLDPKSEKMVEKYQDELVLSEEKLYDFDSKIAVEKLVNLSMFIEHLDI